VTCIVGIEVDGGVLIGGDSATSNRHYQAVWADVPKVFELGPYVFGFTTSWRMGQLLRYRLDVREPDGWDVDRYMATTFVDAVRQTLKDGGWLTKKDEREDGGCFLVGVRGRLYRIDDDFQCARMADGYDAVGSGDLIALGSLYTTRDDPEPQRRVLAALGASSHFAVGVLPPFHLLYGGRT
jgi:hypothetical protein